jgi:hypothetical protein
MRTSAPSVANLIVTPNAGLLPESVTKPFGDPKYRRKLLWPTGGVKTESLSPAVRDTIFVEPVPQPPDDEHCHVAARTTLRSHPFLFKVVTPIIVDRFEQLLATHPNQPFVKSVCLAL